MLKTFIFGVMICQFLNASCYYVTVPPAPCSEAYFQKLTYQQLKCELANHFSKQRLLHAKKVIRIIIERKMNNRAFIESLSKIKDLSEVNKLRIMKSLLGIPQGAHTDFIDFIYPFITDSCYSNKIIKMAKLIPFSDYAHYHRVILPFYEKYSTEAFKKDTITKSLLSIPAEKLTDKFIDFITEIEPTYPHPLYSHIIDLAAKYPQNDFPLLKARLENLATDVPKNHLFSVFFPLINMPLEDHADFINIINVFYNEVKKDKFYIIDILFKFYQRKKETYDKILNISKEKLVFFNKVAQLICAENAIQCFDTIPEKNLNLNFYKKIRRIAKGLSQQDTCEIILYFKNFDLNDIDEAHIKILESLHSEQLPITRKIMNSLLCVRIDDHYNFDTASKKIETYKYISKINKSQLTKKFIRILQKFSSSYCYETMLHTLSYDEFMRTENFKNPEDTDPGEFYLSAKDMLLQETQHVTFDNFLRFYRTADNTRQLKNFIERLPNDQISFINSHLQNPLSFNYILLPLGNENNSPTPYTNSVARFKPV